MSFETLRAHYDLLPQAQQKVLRALDKIPAGFVLYGGTAVALHLGHRSSIDFDFFSSDSYTLDDVKASLSFFQGADFEQLSLEDKDILIQASRDVSLDTIKPSPLDHWSLA